MRLCFANVDLFLGEALRDTLDLDVGVGLVRGDRRKAEGEGIEIVAIELEKDLKLLDEQKHVIYKDDIKRPLI